MDAGSAAERIGEAHLADQPPNFRRYARFLPYIWRLVCTATNMAALVLLFGLGGALVALPPDQRDVVVNPEILGWFLLVEGGWFGLMFFIYIFPRMIFPRRRV
jgi:hypothetical protein